MKTVKLTFNYDFPVFRQTPGLKGIWGDYRFVIDQHLNECDFWVVYTAHDLKQETCLCNKSNIIFLPGEGYETSARFSKNFLQQFGKIITVQKQLKGNNVEYYQNANPWFIEKNYDELIKLPVPEKTKLISIVSSNKDFTVGHRNRLRFVQELKDHFGDQLDFFGRGIRDFEKKWDVTAPYKYHVAIENDYIDDWVTEKFFDPLLTYTFPFYYGCPNITRYMPASSFEPIDINDPAGAIKVIESGISNDLFKKFMANAQGYRLKALNEQQLFPMLVSFLEKMDPSGEKQLNSVKPSEQAPDSLLKKIKRKILNHK